MGNILKHKCVRWARMTHLDTKITSYGQKKGWEFNWQFDSRSLKVGNCPNFLAFRWHATYRWKVLDKGYNFSLDLIFIWGFHTKLWAPKVMEVPTLGILGLPLGSLGTKWHLSVGPMAKHKVYYKGEGDGFPQVWAVVNLVSSCLPMIRPCTKVFQLRINQLVVWFCKFMWIIELFVNLHRPHLEGPTCPPTPEVLQAKGCAPTPSLSVAFTFGLVVESIKELGGVSINHNNNNPMCEHNVLQGFGNTITNNLEYVGIDFLSNRWNFRGI